MHKLYVLSKHDMDVAYQGVQSGHAALRYVLTYPEETDFDKVTLVYLSCPNFKKYRDKMKYSGKHWIEFDEPDLDGEITAMACYADTHIFKSLKLIGT